MLSFLAMRVLNLSVVIPSVIIPCHIVKCSSPKSSECDNTKDHFGEFCKATCHNAHSQNLWINR
jgi:hypothetical protein